MDGPRYPDTDALSRIILELMGQLQSTFFFIVILKVKVQLSHPRPDVPAGTLFVAV